VLRPIEAIRTGARCTWFVPKASPLTARKQWIAGSLKPAGALIVDDGAVKALGQGRSLLPAGVVGVEGEFDRGDAVAVRSCDGREIARGLVAYSAADARRIMGARSSRIEEILGHRGRDEMIHRDDLAVL
jgi:glutamate 5-kinase